jgi:predicted DNA-binding transcriptional regulator AlpA
MVRTLRGFLFEAQMQAELKDHDLSGAGLERLMSADELAILLSVAPASVRRMQARGELPPAIRLGKRLLRWRRSVIEDWLNGLK